jgi:hypothetical protein
MQQGAELVVGVQPGDLAEAQLATIVQPAALQAELHMLLEKNKTDKVGAASLVPLIEAIGLVLHVRGSHGVPNGVTPGSNYSNVLVQLAAYFEESLADLANARVAELVDAEVDELAGRFAHPDFFPQPAEQWPAFTKLASFLHTRMGQMARLRSVGVDAERPKPMYRGGEKPTRRFKVIFKWSGGCTLGKVTELTISPEDSLYDVKVSLCRCEPSLSLESIRLSVLGSPLGFHERNANYDAAADRKVIVGESGLAAGVEITLCTLATAAGSLHC